MKSFYYKDEVWFTEETSSYKLLHGTVQTYNAIQMVSCRSSDIYR